MDDLLVDRWWLAPLLWVPVYVSDFVLTLWGRRLYRQLDGRYVVLESYELNPLFRETVEKEQWVSPRFLLMLGITTGVLAGYAALTTLVGMEVLASVLLAALLGVEALVHLRHLRNIALFRILLRDGGAEGTLRYRLWLSLELSASEALAFGVFLGLVGAVEGSASLAVAGLTCMGLGLRHRTLGRRERARAEAAR